MQIRFVGLVVDDQAKALEFYTSILGFKAAVDEPAGEYRWITVSAPDGAEGIELVLEPDTFPPAKTYQAALRGAGIPATMFVSDDVDTEYVRLKSKGVKFTGEPQLAGNVKLAVFDDTCGNLIQIVQYIQQHDSGPE